MKDSLPHGMYDKNMEILDCGARVLTADIEKQGREYVYYGTFHVQEIQKELESQKHMATVVSPILLVFVLLIGFLPSRRITKSVTVPIQKLCNETERATKGDLTSSPRIEAGDELTISTESFDHMKEKIGRLIEDAQQEQNQYRVMKLQPLQEQINPHFPYNTLDTAVWLAGGGQDRAVVDMVTSLPEFFHITPNGGKDLIATRKEINHIKNCFQIQKVRYQDITNYEVTPKKSLEECRILKPTPQPLMENALYHGIRNRRGEGRTLVRGYTKEDMAVLEVEDNGTGVTEEEIEVVRQKLRGERDSSLQEEPAPKGGFELFDVAERLRLSCGSRCSLEFGSVLGLGIRAVVTIPLESGYGGEGENRKVSNHNRRKTPRCMNKL